VSSWSGKTRGGLLGYKIFVFSLKHLGLSFAYFILRFVVSYFILVTPKSCNITFRYFRDIFNFGFFKSLYKVFKNYFVFGQVLVDKMALLTGCKTKLKFTFEGEKYLHQMVENKTGGLLISAHIGNFEIAGYLLERLHTRINVVMFEAEHEQIKSYLDNIFEEKNVHTISVKNDHSHIFEINKAFENKEIVCMHADRFVDGSKTMKVKFMGRDARFPRGPFYLAMKYNIPLSYVFAMKEKKFHYHFYASAPKLYYKAQINLNEKENFIKSIIADYTTELENVMKKYPEQWFNYFPFWEEGEK
jgi:predicted LPLAT superfamily acyltransferase